MNAIAAADFKNGFGSQFVQPFADTDAIYSSYSHYNNWAKVPSPLGTKTFPWPVNPLGSVVSTNHHQNSINCFNSSANSVAASMSTGNILSNSISTAAVAASAGIQGTPSCPYTTPSNPYSMYHHRTAAAVSDTCTSSIATLRLKAKQHSSSFTNPYSLSPSPINSRGNSNGLSACQYAGMGIGLTDTVWENALSSLLSSSHPFYGPNLRVSGFVDDDDDNIMGAVHSNNDNNHSDNKDNALLAITND